MDPARWERIQALFHAAADLPPDKQQPFLEEASGGDDNLRDSVAALLAEDARDALLLDRDLAGLVEDVLDEPGPRPLPFTRVGRYSIRQAIGEGGMGVVYLAEREDLGSRVAIKILRDAWVSPSRRQRFAAEQRTLARLNHPAIARIYDADALPDGTPWFAMEYVEGLPITEYCRRHASTLAERLHLFRETCEAVRYAHQHLIVHRDLKPSNILVTREPRVKLLDFGISQQLETLDSPVDQTRTIARLMTPAYAAPEQLRGEPAGIHTDVYALGVLLYELLTERRPFDLADRSPGEAEAIVCEQEPERPSAVSRTAAQGHRGRGGSWGDLDVLCLTAMHREPARRYASVEALVRDLDHYLRGEPLEARPDRLGYRMGKFVRRNRQRVAAAVLVTTALVGTVLFYTVQLREQRTRAEIEAEKALQVSDYLIGLFEASDPFAPSTERLDLRQLLELGVQRADRLSAQPRVQAQMLDVLGRVHTRLSEHDRAEDLLRRALSLRRGENEPEAVAETLANLGKLYALMGRRDSAEAHLREALAIRQRHLAPGHPALGVTLNDLGSLLTEKGEFEEAETLYRLALQIQRNAYGRPHEELGQTLSNLGVNHFNRGQQAAAEPFYREALAVDRALYGPAHPNVAAKLANLALVLESRGDFAGADSMVTEALDILQRTLGDDHYLTAYYRIQLGSVLRKKGDHDRAERVLREALAINERVLGAEHPNTTVALNQLALMMSDLGRYADAEPLLRRVVRAFRASVGNRHYYSGSSLTQLAHVLHRNGKADEAEPLFREGLAILESVLPADHQAVVLPRTRLGGLLVTRAKYAEAEQLLRESHHSLLARHGADHAHTREAARNLVELYEAWNKPEQAMGYR